MLIFGDKDLTTISFRHIEKKTDISSTNPGSILHFDFDKKLAKYCQNNDIDYSMIVNNVKELMYANALGCRYAFVDKKFAIKAQNLANEYLFDMKIILTVKNDEEFEWAAKNGIDGVYLLHPQH